MVSKWGLTLGTFLAVGTSEELDTEEQVEALEQVDRVLSRADRLSGATFFGRFLVKQGILLG